MQELHDTLSYLRVFVYLDPEVMSQRDEAFGFIGDVGDWDDVFDLGFVGDFWIRFDVFDLNKKKRFSILEP